MSAKLKWSERLGGIIVKRGEEEFLMKNCECGRMFRRAQIIRFSEQEIKEWKKLDRKYSPKELFLLLITTFIPVISFFSIFIIFHKLFIALSAAIALLILFWILSNKFIDREKRIKKQKQILSAFGDISSEEVCLGEDFWLKGKKYIILPSQEV